MWTTSRGGAYQAWNGTSFSSPLAAGVAAVMMAANPALDGARIEHLLYSTSVDLGAAGPDPVFGFGCVDAGAAVLAAAAMVVVADTRAPSVAINAPLGSSSVSGLVAVQASAVDNGGVARGDLAVNGTTVPAMPTRLMTSAGIRPAWQTAWPTWWQWRMTPPATRASRPRSPSTSPTPSCR
ncbi:S8 family serine peptidase [Massilia eurypsychrophila]|uniref:S8 family serine peptidase n=1 Tax=Massilia eurypsychrophila TaxID=1485217 RepID=UPI0035F29934